MGASLSMTNYPPKGRGAFRFLGSCSIFEIGQARHVKIGVQINHGEYQPAHYGVPHREQVLCRADHFLFVNKWHCLENSTK